MGRTKKFIETLEIPPTEWRILRYLLIGAVMVIISIVGLCLITHHH